MKVITKRVVAQVGFCALLGLGCNRTEDQSRSDSTGASAAPSVAIVAPRSSSTGLPPLPSTHTPDHEFWGLRWTTCHKGFFTEGNPVRDLTRLTYLCAPNQGMRPLAEISTGTLAHDGETVLSFDGRRGGCYRVFVVVSPSSSVVSVQVRDSDGQTIATDGWSSWVVSPGQGLFCASKEGKNTFVIASRGIESRYAAQVWELP